MTGKRKWLLILIFVPVAIGLLILGRPLLHLAWAWHADPTVALEKPAPGTDDESRLSANKPAEVVKVSSQAPGEQLADLVRRAAAEGRRISISGARHSMGGHTLYPGGIVLDMTPFKHMSLDEESCILTVGAGAQWADIIPYLDHRGYAVGVMQSNSDFTVGGSISVNCHGWQNDSPPIAGTVESFRILTADGVTRNCSRTENQELFSLALGGYGLFGVITDVKLRVVPNEFYRAEAHRVNPDDYARTYRELTANRKDVGMAYGRISVAPDRFLEDGLITLLRRVETDRAIKDTLTKTEASELKRLVFRGGVGNDYGKNLRWKLETTIGGETGKNVLSRNQIMNEPSTWFANRDAKRAEILHEYFVPGSQLGEFLRKAKPVFQKHRPDLLNITVRNVERDNDTFLRYAREDVFGLVMLFNQGIDAASESAMQNFARELIDVALACGGTYYLPYRPHATRLQFDMAYPQGRKFFEAKRRYDPGEIFQNKFYLQYGKPPRD